MNVKKRIRDMKLSKKMILAYLIFASITCIVSVLALQISFSIFDEELYGKSLQELEYFTQKVNANLDEINALSFDLAMDESIQLKLYEISILKKADLPYEYHIHELRDMFISKLGDTSGVQSITYTDRADVSFLIGADRGAADEEVYKRLLDRYHDARGGYVMEPPSADYPYMLSGRDILQKMPQITLDNMGSIIITSDIGGVIEKEKSNLAATNSYLWVISSNGVVYQDDEALIIEKSELVGNQGYQIIRDEGQKYFQCFLKSPVTGWTYMNVFPYSEVYGKSMTLRYAVISMFIVLFMAMFFLMKKMTKIITRPLVRLNESMQIVATGDFQGARNIIRDEDQQDEAGMLSKEFCIMLEKIDELIHENYEKQLLIKDTKYRMLQAQINPHFLYNTLNAINWMVKAERNKDAVKMIMRLGELLRASFTEDPYIRVSEEVKVAESYMTIQKYRYGSRIEFSVMTEGALDAYMMPRMILQPLIENAIYYGAESMPGTCRIVVNVLEKDQHILFEVSDTGIGMSEDDLALIRSFDFTPKGHGIGLMNIRERLNISYDSYEFSIESALGQGTVISILIPKEGRMSNV